MIEIKPDSNYKKLAEYTQMESEDNIFMSARDGDELLGAVALSADGEITAVRTEADFLYDGLIKSAINFFDRRNIKTVTCRCDGLALYLKKIGFENVDDKWVINTDKFFGTDCTGKN